MVAYTREMSRDPAALRPPPGLNSVPALSWGSHLCQLYRTKQDLVEVLVPYFVAGLRNHEKCLWIASAPLCAEEAKAALAHELPDADERIAAGQLTILDHKEWYLRAGALGTKAVLQGWVEREQEALQSGYAGLRLNGNTAWLDRGDWSSFLEYEAKCQHVFRDRQILALCSYSLDACTSDDVVDVLHNHELALARRGQRWEIVHSAIGMLASLGAEGAPQAHRPLAWTGPASDAASDADAGRAVATPATRLGELEALRAALAVKDTELDRERARTQALEAERTALTRAEVEARANAAAARDQLVQLQNVTSALSEAASMAEIARIVVTDIAELLGAAKAILAVPTADGRSLRLLDQSGLLEHVIKAHRVFPVDAPLPVATSFSTQQPIWLPTPEAVVAQYPNLEDAIATTQAVASAPLTIRGRSLGGLGFGWPDPREFSASDRALVLDLARQVALALERARLYDDARRARDRLELLSDVASRIAGGKLDLEQILQTIVDEVTARLAECCSIALRAPGSDTLSVVALRHVEASLEGEIRSILESAPVETARSLNGRVVDSGEPILLAHVPADAFATLRPEHRGFAERHPIRSLVIVPLRVSGTVIGTISGARQASERPFTEQDRDLLQEIADRAALAISNAQLYDRIQEASRRKDEFLAILGHELRNPLAPITTAVQLMRLRGGTQLVREREVIERQVQHVRRLVDDLLDISRITRGHLELRRERVDLETALGRAVEMASPLIEQRRHRLHLEPFPEPVYIAGDPMRLAQILGNLLTNAARYSARGGRIEVSWRRQRELVSVSVRDTGIGIPAEKLDTIFESFVQAKRNVEGAHGGLGLGLALVKSLVELHGGRVVARSDGPGKGSEFTVTLPAAEEARVVPEPSTARTEARVSPEERRRVLIVDDNADAADVLAELLEAVGHEVRVAYDGPQALAIAEANPLDLAILDIGLPVMDGYELASRLRERHGPLRLIAVTGYGMSTDRQRSRAAGFEAHFTKPVDHQGLLSRVETSSDPVDPPLP
jgi:signal transduction histidine kinase/ActR/RegA family two-component response regulator